MLKIVIAAALLAAALLGCADTTKYQDYPEIGPANGPTAIVHVVRESGVFGSAITAPVYVNRYLIGRIGPGGHLRTRVPVGRVHVTSTTADAVVQAEADSEYFFELSMPVQLWAYNPEFVVVKIDRRRAEALGATR
jgi:hypothetical protein